MVISRIEMEEGSDDGDDDDGVTDTDDRAGSTEEDESSDDAPRRASMFAMVVAVVVAADIRIMVMVASNENSKQVASRRRWDGGVFLRKDPNPTTKVLRVPDHQRLSSLQHSFNTSAPQDMVVGVAGGGSLLQKRIRATCRRSQWVQIGTNPLS
jgi:hypothetical protein